MFRDVMQVASFVPVQGYRLRVLVGSPALEDAVGFVASAIERSGIKAINLFQPGDDIGHSQDENGEGIQRPGIEFRSNTRRIFVPGGELERFAPHGRGVWIPSDSHDRFQLAAVFEMHNAENDEIYDRFYDELCAEFVLGLTGSHVLDSSLQYVYNIRSERPSDSLSRDLRDYLNEIGGVAEHEPTGQEIIDSVIEQIRSVSDPLGRIALGDELTKTLMPAVYEQMMADAAEYREGDGTWVQIGERLGISADGARKRLLPAERELNREKSRERMRGLTKPE
jgi:hypothetical protein